MVEIKRIKEGQKIDNHHLFLSSHCEKDINGYIKNVYFYFEHYKNKIPGGKYIYTIKRYKLGQCPTVEENRGFLSSFVEKDKNGKIVNEYFYYLIDAEINKK